MLLSIGEIQLTAVYVFHCSLFFLAQLGVNIDSLIYRYIYIYSIPGLMAFMYMGALYTWKQ